MMLVTRQLFRSSVHGLFLFSYEYQISILSLVDICYIVLIIVMRKCFVSRFVFAFVLFYNINFFAFDLFFFLEVHFPSVTATCDRELFGWIALSSMALFTLLETIYFLFEPLIKLIKKKCFPNIKV